MPSTLGSSRMRIRSVWALPSNPPQPAPNSSSARSPLCPNGGWPMSWASPAVSTTSGSAPSSSAIARPIWATSSEWVSRVRGTPLTSAPSPGPTTCVLPASRRSAAECSTRARSRANGLRRPFPAAFGGSGSRRAVSRAV